MAKVSQETVERLNAFLDTLPVEAQNKCTLCTETLTHIVKTAEAQTGAPLATVTRELASRVNDGAAPSDKVSGEALRQRTLEMSGEKNRNCSNGTNKPEQRSDDSIETESKECPVCGSVYPGDQDHCPNGCEKAAAEKPERAEADQFSARAISQLSRIRPDDTKRAPELIKVLDWIVGQVHDSGDTDALATCVNKLGSYIASLVPDCHRRKLSTEDRDEILFLVNRLFPGRNDGWLRAWALNESGLKCGKKKDSPWTPTEVRNNLRHAKIRQNTKTERG